MEITLAKGGDAERTIDVSQIHIPDLWHLAMWLRHDSNGGNSSGGAYWADLVLETWHLAHDMRRELQELANK